MVNRLNPLDGNTSPATSNTSPTTNNPSVINRVTSFFRSLRPGASQSSAAPVASNPPITIEKETLDILNAWLKEAPEEIGRKKFFDAVISFLSSNGRISLHGEKLGLTSLPDIFKDPSFKRLQYLKLSTNELACLPNVANLTNLKTLDVSFNKIKELPEGFDRLTSLERLGLKCNCLSNFSPSLLEILKGLKQLNVSDNLFTEIPDELIHSLGNNLDVKNNPNGYLAPYTPPLRRPIYSRTLNMPSQEPTKTIDNLEEEDVCKKALELWKKATSEGENREKACNIIVSFLMSDEKCLNLRNLGLNSLPDIFNDSRFNRLKSLDLSNNKLESVPEELINSNSLIDIHNNKFSTLPTNLREKLINQSMQIKSFSY